MKLHESPSDFEQVILATAQRLNIPDVFVEKDYWVTLVLYRLSQYSQKSKIVFKGGTSLAKAYGLRERFSEDVDLAMTDIGALTGSQVKTLIANVSKELTKSPLADVNDERTSKGSRFRRTVHQFPRLSLSAEFGAASPHLLLEINSFTDPSPMINRKIRSFIGDFLASQSPDDLVKYDLDFFEVQVLGVDRTYVEKLMGLIRHSFSGPQEVRAKIRHLYDLARLEANADILRLKGNATHFKWIVHQVKETDRRNPDFSGDWLDQDLSQAPLFISSEIKAAMKAAYEGNDLRSLILNHERTPSFEEAWSILMDLAAFFHQG